MEQYLPLWAFIVLMVVTPGPANLLMMSAGAQHGFRDCVPFGLGLISGKFLLNLAMVIGLGTLLTLYPLLGSVLAYFSALYMSWLALRGWNARPERANSQIKPSFYEGLLVHPLNPKAWMMTTLAFSQFGAGFEQPWQRYILIPLSFAVAQSILHSGWCVAGSALSASLGSSLALNRSLIVITLATVLWALVWSS